MFKQMTITRKEAQFIDEKHPQLAKYLTVKAAGEYTLVVDGRADIKMEVNNILNTKGPNKLA